MRLNVSAECLMPNASLHLPVALVGAGEVPRRGAEHPAQTPRKKAISDQGGAESGAPDAPNALRRPNDPSLCRIIDTWPDLPEAIRAGIVAMVRAAVE